MQKKLIYILNHYSKDSTQHFFHVINLLKEIASQGADIVLVIEKCDGVPDIYHPGIRVIAQQKHQPLLRALELRSILSKLSGQGFKKVFIRISAPAALIAKTIPGMEVYFWQSGTVNEFNKSLPWGKIRLKNYFSSELPFSLVLKTVDWFVTGPESMGTYYHKVFNVPVSKIKILYNDIDVSRFQVLSASEKLTQKEALSIPADHRVILFVHRLSPVRKTLYYMPFILERFLKEDSGQTTIILIGDGSERAELSAGVKSLNSDRVLMLGSMPNQEIQKYYAIADIFINPTHAEGFPRVLIEAMACGLPLVTTDAGGIRDILPPEQLPFMVDKNDREAFANALIALSNDTAKMSELRQINRDWVQRYSTEKIAKMYLDVIFLAND